MDKFVKSLKTTKRRLSQQFKVATGKSDVTSDATFDIAYRKFTDLESNLRALSSQCCALIHNVDTWCDTNRKLADELMRFTNKTDVETEDMEIYKDTISNLHTALQSEYNLTRRSIICVLRAHIICRIDALLKEDYAEVEKVVKVRKNILTDYDSHRAKCSNFEKKGDSGNAEKFRMKMDHDYQMLGEHTSYLEIRFDELIAVGTAILSRETATLVACEMYLVRRQHEAMEAISGSFPQNSIRDISSSIDSIVERIKEGENVEMNYIAPEICLPVFPFHDVPIVTDYTVGATYGEPKVVQSHTVYEETHPSTYGQVFANPPPVPAPLPIPKSIRHVRALYSLDTVGEGELKFTEGDEIEVIREDTSGWWEGRLNGHIGRFPSNYTSAVYYVCCNKTRDNYESLGLTSHKQRLRSSPDVNIPVSFQSQEYIIRLCPLPSPERIVRGTPCDE